MRRVSDFKRAGLDIPRDLIGWDLVDVQECGYVQRYSYLDRDRGVQGTMSFETVGGETKMRIRKALDALDEAEESARERED